MSISWYVLIWNNFVKSVFQFTSSNALSPSKSSELEVLTIFVLFFFFKKNFKPYLLLYFKYVSILLVLRMFLFIIASYSFSPVTISSLASQWILIIHISSKLSSLYTVCFLQVAFCIFHTFHIAGIPQISSNSRGPKTLIGSSDTWVGLVTCEHHNKMM